MAHSLSSQNIYVDFKQQQEHIKKSLSLNSLRSAQPPVWWEQNSLCLCTAIQWMMTIFLWLLLLLLLLILLVLFFIIVFCFHCFVYVIVVESLHLFIHPSSMINRVWSGCVGVQCGVAVLGSWMSCLLNHSDRTRISRRVEWPQEGGMTQRHVITEPLPSQDFLSTITSSPDYPSSLTHHKSCLFPRLLPALSSSPTSVHPLQIKLPNAVGNHFM